MPSGVISGKAFEITLFGLDQAQDFLSGLFGKSVILYKTAHFCRIDSGIFRKGSPNPVSDVVVFVLGAGQAELPKQRPIGAILVLNLENDRAATHPHVRVADPRGNL